MAKFYHPALQDAAKEGDLLDNFKVITCPHTERQVVALIDDNEPSGYLCLHTGDADRDHADVTNFYHSQQ